ncbi:hypothetical protein [Bacillus luti]|uniref:hypothetical protein n=1 Tax=Bacillus luti TaxID=2026191 RepID=UPI00289EE111|nr:hypothetical protein [Bacillus luti]
MSKVTNIEIQCTNCNTWFQSPIYFGGMDSFDTSMLVGNITNCPSCNQFVSCNKENMRVRSNDGGFKGNETK